jgi:hypothetical protein
MTEEVLKVVVLEIEVQNIDNKWKKEQVLIFVLCYS